MIIERKDVRKLVEGFKGEIFSALFFKVDGSVRDMSCRLHVKKNLSDLASVNPDDLRSSLHRKDQDEELNLLTVFDMNKITGNDVKGAYRRINIDTLVEIRHGGIVYKVKD